MALWMDSVISKGIRSIGHDGPPIGETNPTHVFKKRVMRRAYDIEHPNRLPLRVVAFFGSAFDLG